MPRIAALHTAESNVRVFDRALREIGAAGVVLTHRVRADLLDAARAEGGLNPDIVERTGAALMALREDADAVLLTCSTLGPAAAAAGEISGIPILRVDAALARRAVADGGRVAVLCAVPTTMEPTRSLFEEAARRTGAEIAMHLVPDAWTAFEAGDEPRYLDLIAAAADDAQSRGATRVALAQASMAGAAERVSGRRPLTSPAVGLAAALDAASS